MCGNQGNTPAGIRVRIIARNRRSDAIQIRLRLREGRVGLQPADAVVGAMRPRRHRGRVDRQRRPQLDFGVARGKLKRFRHHTDNFVARIVEHQRAAQHGRVQTKTPRPRGVTEDDRLRGAGLLFFRRKDAPQFRSDAEHGEQQRRYVNGGQAFGLTLCAKREPLEPPDGDALKR